MAKSGKEFIESMAKSDELVDHTDDCGMCHHQIVMAEVAREILATGDFDDAIHRWSKQTKERWEESKYFKLYQEETKLGRNPSAAFEEKGWEM